MQDDSTEDHFAGFRRTFSAHRT